jgi:hypothetical protein
MTSLHAQQTLVSDLSCLEGTEIFDVRLDYSPIDDPSPLRNCRVVTLWLPGCRISDFSALAGHRLGSLCADNNPWMGGALPAVSSLMARACQIEDGEAIAAVTASTIDLSMNPLKKIGKLADRTDLRRLWFWSPTLPDAEIERCAHLWRSRSLPHLSKVADAYMAIRNADAAGLRRALAVGDPNRRDYRLPLSCPIHEARTIATRLGARLAESTSSIHSQNKGVMVAPTLTWD